MLKMGLNDMNIKTAFELPKYFIKYAFILFWGHLNTSCLNIQQLSRNVRIIWV